MKRTAALRVTGDICFYFSVLTLFPAFQRWTLPMAGFALACLVIGLIAVGLRSMPLRLVLSLLPGVCLFFGELSPLLIVPGLAWLYFILYLSFGRFGIDLYDYRMLFRWMLILSAFVLAIQAVNAMLFGGAPLSYVSLAYMAAFILLAVIAMRGMQMGAKMDARWHTANTLTVAVVLFAAVGVSLLAYQLYLHSVPLLVALISPLKRVLAWLFGLIRFRPVRETPTVTPPPEQINVGMPVALPHLEIEENIESEIMPDRTILERLADQATNIGAFLVIAALVFVILWIIVKLIRRGREFAAEDVVYEQTEAFTPDRRRRKAKPEAVHGQANAVRKIYREYLDYLQENGLQRSAADTSAEILAESERISPASAPAEETLRRVYLKARYSAETVTEADVDAARSSLDAIRSREK